MIIRSKRLPGGWYPESGVGVSRQIKEFLSRIADDAVSPGLSKQEGVAGVVPHAGWAFSGRVALEVWRQLPSGAETVVVIGGHLLGPEGILAWFEEGYDTPLGVIRADLELLDYLKERLIIGKDRAGDNTVEVQLPFIKYLLPRSRVLGLRAAPSEQAISLGKILEQAGRDLGRQLVVIGSTDLTHYGPNYGFTPQGSSAEAVRWVKEVNDRRIIESLVNLDLGSALERGVRERSACSIGGAVAAAGFARARGVERGTLLHYANSYDLYPADSFVGYAGIIFPGDGE